MEERIHFRIKNVANGPQIHYAPTCYLRGHKLDDWQKFFLAALTGGLVVKVLDIVYQEIRKRLDTRGSKKVFVDGHLEPLLKSADELVGKLRAHIESDFKELDPLNGTEININNHEVGSTIYLFCRFWSQLEIVRTRGLTNTFADERRGKKLYNFIDCMESRRVRLLPRIVQRAIGESITENDEPISFIDFCEKLNRDETLQMWIRPLVDVLNRTGHTTQRQSIMQYGVVIHAMIDDLDPKHRVTRKRPSWPNKLSRKSWRALRYRVFKVYLRTVDFEGYIGPKKG